MRLFALALSALLVLTGAAEAFIQNNVVAANNPFHGPGSPGFRPYAFSDFTITNIFASPNNFQVTWTIQHGGSAASNPVLTPNQPDVWGGNTATAVSIPAVNAATSWATIAQTYNMSGGYSPYDATIWVQNNGPCKIYWGASSSTGTFPIPTTPIPADGLWHQVDWQVQGSVFTTSTQMYWFIGIDTREAAETFCPSTTTFNIARANLIGAYNVKVFPFLPDTSAHTVTIPLPLIPGTYTQAAFRDPAALRVYGGSGKSTDVAIHVIPTPGSNAGYNTDSQLALMPQQEQWNPVTQMWYATGISQRPSDSNTYPFLTYYTTTNPPFNWVECTSGAPKCPASNPNPINAAFYNTAPLLGQFNIQAMFLPGSKGCITAGGVSYVNCLFYTGKTTTSSQSAMFMMENNDASTIGYLSPYTSYNAGTVTAVLGPTTSPSWGQQPATEAFYHYGNKFYMVSGISNAGNSNTVLWTSPDSGNGKGVTWTYRGSYLQPPVSTDWDNGWTFFDNWFFKTTCGFLEYHYTAFLTNNQKEGEAVAVNPDGPVYKYNAAPFVNIDSGSPLYPLFGGGGNVQVGDPAPISVDGLYYYFVSYAGPGGKGTNLATMPDACPMQQRGQLVL